MWYECCTSDDPVSQCHWSVLLPCLYSSFHTAGNISCSSWWFQTSYYKRFQFQDFCVVCVSTYAVNVLLFFARCIHQSWKFKFPLTKLSCNLLRSWCKRCALGNVRGNQDRWERLVSLDDSLEQEFSFNQLCPFFRYGYTIPSNGNNNSKDGFKKFIWSSPWWGFMGSKSQTNISRFVLAVIYLSEI